MLPCQMLTDECDKPQELRLPEYMTARPNVIAVRLMETYSVLSSPAIINRNMTNFALETLWPDMTNEKAKLILSAMMDMDKMYSNLYKQIEETEAQEPN